MRTSRILLIGLFAIWLIDKFTTSAEAVGLAIAALIMGGALLLLLWVREAIHTMVDRRAARRASLLPELEG